MFKEHYNQMNSSPVTTLKTSTKKVPTYKFKKPVDDIDKAIQAFLTGKTGKFGKYLAVENALVYRTIATENHGKNMDVLQDVIAIKIDRPEETIYVGNSSNLPLIGRSVSFGRESLNRSVTEVQTRLSAYIQMIPFSVFFEAGLNLMKINILERGPEMQVIRDEQRYNSKKKENEMVPVEVHYTGASLFQVEDKMFLFDIDQREIKHRIFNAFLVQLKTPAKTIAEAYQNLKPSEVVEAEKAGLEVLRQGEWFFIPVNKELEAVKNANRSQWNNQEFQRLELRAGRNRPNVVTKYAVEGKTNYVTGKVEHSGREHAALMLKGWYLPVPNTSIESFTLTGDVD